MAHPAMIMMLHEMLGIDLLGLASAKNRLGKSMLLCSTSNLVLIKFFSCLDFLFHENNAIFFVPDDLQYQSLGIKKSLKVL